MPVKLVLAALLTAAAYPAFSQAAPEAAQGGFPLAIGVGFSDFSSDFNGRLQGAAVWADWNFIKGPGVLGGLGIEVEGRDLNYGRTGAIASLRQDTAEGGAIYTIRHYRKFQPYGKCLFGLGSMDFGHQSPTYSHDTRTVIVPGGGLEYRAWSNIWVRGDWEYQFWPHFFNDQALKPNGFTIGATYHFWSF
jgi:opacity protein-like surface antigen